MFREKYTPLGQVVSTGQYPFLPAVTDLETHNWPDAVSTDVSVLRVLQICPPYAICHQQNGTWSPECGSVWGVGMKAGPEELSETSRQEMRNFN